MTVSNVQDILPERLGPFLVIRRLARGGMAELYIGEKVEPFDGPQTVVLKVWRAPAELAAFDHDQVQELLGRLIEEGRLGSRLNHPNIVQTFGVHRDPEQDLYYLVQEYVDGIKLGDLMDYYCERQLHVPFHIVLEILIPVLRALHYAYHEALREDGRPLRVVHRDIKPDNIMIGFSGAVKLVDFGVARSTSLTRPVTVGDFVLGTRHYMAPEQVYNPEAVGHRSDVFTTALILYELCTLKPLFPRTRVLQEFAEALTRFRFEDHAHHLDAARFPGLREVLARALQSEPKDRYENGGEMADALEALRAQVPEEPSWDQFLSQLKTDMVESGRARAPGSAANGRGPQAGREALDGAVPVKPEPAATPSAEAGRADKPPAGASSDAGWDDVVTVLIEKTGAGQTSDTDGVRGRTPTAEPSRSNTSAPAPAPSSSTPPQNPPRGQVYPAAVSSTAAPRPDARASATATTGRYRVYSPPGPPDPPPWENERVRSAAAAKSAEQAATAAAADTSKRALLIRRLKWIVPIGVLVLGLGAAVAWVALH